MARKRPPFDIGEPVDLDVRFYNANGKLDDPDTISLRILCPNATIVAKTKTDLVQIAKGIWRYIYTINAGPGAYRGTWTAHGNVDVVRQFSFPVRKQDGG